MGGGNLLDIKAPNDGSGSSGSLNIGDLILAGDMSINRFAGLPTNVMKFEYSTNDGESGQEYPMNNYQKSNVFSKNNCAVMYLGGEAKNESERNRLKITIELPTPCYFFYCRMKSFILFVSTNGVKKLYVKITADDKKIICENRELLGGGGNNSIYFADLLFGGQESNYHKFTFEFWQEKNNDPDYPGKGNNAYVSSIFGYANNVHNMSSNLAKTGHLYRFEQNQAIFPLQVYGNNDFSDKSRFLTSSEIDAKIQSAFTGGEYN